MICGRDIFAAAVVSTHCYVRAGRLSEDPSVPVQTGENQTKQSLMQIERIPTINRNIEILSLSHKAGTKASIVNAVINKQAKQRI